MPQITDQSRLHSSAGPSQVVRKDPMTQRAKRGMEIMIRQDSMQYYGKMGLIGQKKNSGRTMVPRDQG